MLQGRLPNLLTSDDMATEHKVRPIGSTFRYDGRKYHIIGHCYDEDKDGKKLIYIVKFFGKYKQWWHYEVMTSEEFDWHIKDGVLKAK